MNKIKLAIIIPAYKRNFLENALLSISNQSDKRFRVYVGDDASPENIEEIVSKFKNSFDVNYQRFETNLGKNNLVGQWARCVDLIGDEEWIWLFSDDDVADENCVKLFYNALNETNNVYDVYRFNTKIINNKGCVTCNTPLSPQIESAYELSVNILNLKRGTSMPDHIWKRKAYIEYGGFVSSPFAQASDWASSVKFAQKTGIYSIDKAFVYWRNDGYNISSNVMEYRTEKILAHINSLSVIWNLISQKHLQKQKLDKLEEAIKFNIKHIIRFHYQGVDLRDVLQVSRIISQKLPINFYLSLWILIRLKLQNIILYLKRTISKFFKLMKL